MKDNALEIESCERVCFDTIGPWEMSVTEYQKGKRGHQKKSGNKIVKIHAMTMIDEATP